MNGRETARTFCFAVFFSVTSGLPVNNLTPEELTRRTVMETNSWTLLRHVLQVNQGNKLV